MKDSEQNIYKNITVIIAGFLLLAILFDLEILIYISTVIGVGSVLIPAFGRLINWIWLKIAHVLGWVNSRILLSVIFFLFLVPIALISRLFRKDPLSLKKGNGSSYYTDRDYTFKKEDLINPW